MLLATGHYLVVEKTDVQEKTAGGVLLPASVNNPTVEVIVRSIGNLVECEVEEDDQIITMSNALSVPIKAAGKEYYLVKDEHVLAIRA